MKVKMRMPNWYIVRVYLSMCIVIGLASAFAWTLRDGASADVVVVPKISITEDWKLVDAQLDDGSKFSITIKEARALREVVRMLLVERMAELGAELFAARGGVTVGTVHPEHHLRLLEALVAKLSELRDILSVQEAK